MNIDLTLNLADIVMNNSELSKRAEGLFKAGHFGTHLDIHGKTRVPLDYMQSRGLLFDVSHINERDIELSDFDFDRVRAGDFVIFKTDMIRRHAYGTQPYFLTHPQLSQPVIDYLIDKKTHFIGIDAAGIRRGNQHVIADKQCEEQGIYIIENLDNLTSLTPYQDTPFQVTTLWIDMPGRTGLPCRVVATPA